MGAPEANTSLIYGIHIRESANDGSDFSNAASDYRVLFLGEDGELHVKDSAGAVTGFAGTGIASTIVAAKGDIIGASANDTPAITSVGTNGKVLMAASAQSTGLKWTYGLYMSTRIMATAANTSETLNINTTSYTVTGVTEFYHDWDQFPATHFHISCFGQSNEGSQTVSVQLTPGSDATNPVSSGGNDLVITNTLGTHTSGWVAVSDSMSGLTLMCLSVKGSTSTVDLASRWLDIAFKIAS